MGNIMNNNQTLQTHNLLESFREMLESNCIAFVFELVKSICQGQTEQICTSTKVWVPITRSLYAFVLSCIVAQLPASAQITGSLLNILIWIENISLDWKIISDISIFIKGMQTCETSNITTSNNQSWLLCHKVICRGRVSCGFLRFGEVEA